MQGLINVSFYEEKAQLKASPEGKERNDKTMKDKYEIKRQRIFQAHWKEVYPWVKHDSIKDLMFCKVCEVQQKNLISVSLVLGQACTSFNNQRHHHKV